MTHPADDKDPGEAVRTRNLLVRRVRAQLKGQGLDIRELENDLAISRPGYPDKGRIYIKYANSEVSHGRMTWTYLGHLDGLSSDAATAEPRVNTDTIINMLTGQDSDSP
jgi:hypothetical protein